MSAESQKSKKWLEERTYHVGIVEKWVPFPKPGHRVDLYGIIDMVAVRFSETGVLGVQATSASNARARVIKALENDKLPIWLRCGNRFEVHSWGKQGARGRRKTWTLRRQRALIEEGVVIFMDVSPELDAGLESVDGSAGVEIPASEPADQEVAR